MGELESTAPDGLTWADWSELHIAHELAQHAVVESGQGFAARNPGQSWSITFDGRGFVTQPDASDWRWGLRLGSFGFAGSMESVGEAACYSAKSNRMFHDWSANLQEWYVNAGSGLEHGYTIQSRPAQGADAGSPLVLDLEVLGNLGARIADNGSAVRFIAADGASVVNYAGLYAFDANGVTQPATFRVDEKHVFIQVEERHATYPLTADPIAQQTYLKASNTDLGDRFGTAVAVSGA